MYLSELESDAEWRSRMAEEGRKRESSPEYRIAVLEKKVKELQDQMSVLFVRNK